MEIYIGIYGGHQKSYAVALTQEKILGCLAGDSLNLHTFNYHKVIVRLRELLNNLARKIDIDPPRLQDRTRRMVLALPGAALEVDQQLAEYCLNQVGWKDWSKYKIVDDTWAGLYGGALSTRGICAFAGTGASVFVGLGDLCNGKVFKMDGWGPVLGDFGSSFQLAVDFFRFLGRQLDKGVIPPLFDEILNEDPSILSTENVQNWFDQLFIFHPEDWRIKFAKLAAPITRAADRDVPDPDAVKLVTAAATDMACTIEIALERFLGQKEGLPIVMQGGMFQHSNLYRETIITILKKKYSNRAAMAQYKTIFGAALLAYTNLSTSIDKSELQLLRASIDNLSEADRDLLVYPALQ